MERKLSVADFASLIGTTPKTIYERIKINDKLPVNERLNVVKERINGREAKVIATNSEQIDTYKEIYGKSNVINGECYDIVTDNNDKLPVNERLNVVKDDNNDVDLSVNTEKTEILLDKLIKVNEDYNNRIEQKTTELITLQKELANVKSRQLLLEDKANREGLYLQEIKDLKKENNGKDLLIKVLITVIVSMLLIAAVVITYYLTVNYR